MGETETTTSSPKYYDPIQAPCFAHPRGYRGHLIRVSTDSSKRKLRLHLVHDGVVGAGRDAEAQSSL